MPEVERGDGISRTVEEDSWMTSPVKEILGNNGISFSSSISSSPVDAMESLSSQSLLIGSIKPSPKVRSPVRTESDSLGGG